MSQLFRALHNTIDVRSLAPMPDKAEVDGGEHPFTYCKEVVIPAIEKKNGPVDDPDAFCLAPGSEIHTMDGLVSIENLQPGSLVKTTNGRWQPTQGSVVSVPNFSGNLLKISSKLSGTPIRVTPGHRMWASKHGEEPCFVPASDLTTDDYLAFPVVHGKSKVDLPDDLIRLLGWYAGDGHVDLNRGVVTLTLGYPKKEVGEGFERCCRSIFGSNVRWTDFAPYGQKSWQVTTSNRELAEFLVSAIGAGARHKKFAPWVVDLPLRQMELVLEGYWQTDGHCRYREDRGAEFIASTSSQILGLQIRDALLATGCRPRIFQRRVSGTEKILGREVQVSDSWTVTHNGPVQRNKHLTTENFVLLPVTQVVPDPYEGPLYDAQVSGDESFSGVYWTAHNCGWWKAERAAGHIETKVARTIHLQGATGEMRTASYEGRDHIVVPVVALVEGVIHAINASDPELVTLACLACAPQGWNGRPIVLGHPVKNGRQISANSPEVLEQQAFGRIFQTRVAGRKLLMEAWIDPVRAEAVGAGPLLARIRANQMVEVSVGAFVVTEAANGMHGDKPYKAIWKDLVPDHLAFLPRGVGACSNEMGCGTPRMAAMVTAEGFAALSNPEGINQYTHGDRVMVNDKNNPDHGRRGQVTGKNATHIEVKFALPKMRRGVPETHGYFKPEHLSPLKLRGAGGPGSGRHPAGSPSGYPTSRQSATTFAHDASRRANQTGSVIDHQVAASAHSVAKAYHRANGDPGAADEHQRAVDFHSAKAAGRNVRGLMKETRSASNPEGINQYTKGGGVGKTAESSSKSAHDASVLANSRQGSIANQARADQHSDAAMAHGKAADAHDQASREAKNQTTRDYHNEVARGHRSFAESHAKAAGTYATIAPRDSGGSGDPHHVVDNNGRKVSTHPTGDLAQAAAQKLANDTGGRHAVVHTKTDTMTSEHFLDVTGYLKPRSPRDSKSRRRNTGAKPRTAAGIYDSPEQIASEEAAELIAYETLRTICDQLGDSYKATSTVIDDLIAAEEETPTISNESEQSEEELETAQLQSVRTLCMAMYSSINAMQGLVSELLSEGQAAAPSCCSACGGEDEKRETCDACAGTGMVRAAAGARHSAEDRQIIQGVHDQAVSLGAECGELRSASNPEGINQYTKGAAGHSKHHVSELRHAGEDRSAEDGSRAAASKNDLQDIADEIDDNYSVADAVDDYNLSADEADELKKLVGGSQRRDASEGATMTKEQREEAVRSLVANKHSGFTAGDEKMLEAASDERLESLRVAAAAREVEVKETTALRTAGTTLKPLSEEDFLKIAPESIRTLLARQQAADAALKTQLVSTLKAAQSEYTESELATQPVEFLQRLARACKVSDKAEEETNGADYSGRGLPRQLTADEKKNNPHLNPPDPYAAGIKTLQSQLGIKGEGTIQ